MTKEISNQDIDDLMVTALEGGINYWCGKATITKLPAGVKDGEEVIASDMISRDGVLTLFDAESADKWELTREKFIKGLVKTIEWGDFGNVQNLMDGHDAETADVLIQYALFDEIVFG